MPFVHATVTGVRLRIVACGRRLSYVADVPLVCLCLVIVSVVMYR